MKAKKMKLKTLSNVSAFLATLMLCVAIPSFDLLAASDQEAGDKTKKTVIVMGMIHSGHRQHEVYSLDRVQNLIRQIKPDYVLTEIPPDRLETAAEQFRETGKITEPRVRVFPEYTDALFPLTKTMDFKIIPCAAWTTEMNDSRRATMAKLKTTHADQFAEMEQAQKVAAENIATIGNSRNPAVIHTDQYDAFVKQGMQPYDKHFNQLIGAGGWENINAAHYALIEKALDEHAGEGKTFLITFGSWHKYYIKEQLAKRSDVNQVSMQKFLTEKAVFDTDEISKDLKEHLLFLSTFDGTTTAQFAKGDAQLFTADGRKSIGDAKAGLHDPAVSLAVGKGRTGDALEFKSKKRKLTFYKSTNNIAYDESKFSGAISFWLQLDPAKDLEPGFCDPIQITDVSYNDAAIWVDFTKKNPRDFRLGVIGDLESWNPKKLKPDENPGFDQRLIKLKNPAFSRDKWTHVLINFAGLNSDKAKTQFYFDGKLVGELDVNDPFTWAVEKSNILLGLSYIGLMDELAIFDRPLTEAEIGKIFKDKAGLAKLLGVADQSQAKPKSEQKSDDGESLSANELQELIRRSTSQLIEIQENDGAWPYEGVYRVRRKIPVGYRIGGTSIVCSSLLYADDRAESTAAIERGVALILKELENPAMKASVRDAYDVRVWGHIYALDLFCRIRASKRIESVREKTDAWIPKLVEVLKRQQIADGGWNYAGQRRHASFVTAPAVQALLWAKHQGQDVPDSVFEKAKEVLKSSRTDKGAFQYSGTVGRRAAALPGSIARSAACESTLTLLGQGNVDHLRAAIDAFHEHWNELEKRRKKTGTHKPPYNVAPYYFYYGHRYLAQSIQFLPESERDAATQKFAKVLLKTKDPDDTWNDRIFDRSKAYGTAMSILSLANEVPTPPALK